MVKRIAYSDLKTADLFIDAIYEGGALKNSGGGSNPANDPVHRLLPVRNRGGIRETKRTTIGRPLVVLYLSHAQVDWPDRLDPATGDLIYFGDNRSPGHQLLEKQGNTVLNESYGLMFDGERSKVPAFLVFEKVGASRDTRFVGLAAPGSPRLTPGEELVGRWYLHPEGRFQNFEAHFTILKVESVSRQWLDELTAGERLGKSCPTIWRQWVETGHYEPLITSPVERPPSKAQQLPQDAASRKLLEIVHAHFSANPFKFEAFAGEMLRQHRPGLVGEIDYTRPYVDGGRDAVGKVLAGRNVRTVIGEFALEAKCFSPDTAVTVSQVSRLSGRLRGRMFGAFVTTSYIARQAYDEVRLQDRRPVLFLTGRDIVDLLREMQKGRPKDLTEYVVSQWPVV